MRPAGCSKSSRRPIPAREGVARRAMEEVAPGRGFRAATPILSASGRCLGAICLMDGARRTLLTGLQRRLFAEFGDLVAPALGGTRGCADLVAEKPRTAPRDCYEIADADPEAFALFDIEGRCLLRNARFDELLGITELRDPGRDCCRRGAGLRSELDRSPSRPRHPAGRRLSRRPGGRDLAHASRNAAGRTAAASWPASSRATPSAVLATCSSSSSAAPSRCSFSTATAGPSWRSMPRLLHLYGWDRDAFLRLDLDGIGPVTARNLVRRTAGLTGRGTAGPWRFRAAPSASTTAAARPCWSPS